MIFMVSPLKTYKYTSDNVKIYVSIRINLGSEPRFIRLEAGFIRSEPRFLGSERINLGYSMV